MSPKLDVKLLGGITFMLDGQPLKSVPTRAAQALLVYLLHQPHPVERERLIDLFYQASAPKQAAANFRSTLSRLRKDLKPFLEITHQSVAITPGCPITVDAQAFSDYAAQAAWEKAIHLYQGEFLAGFHLREAPEFEEWVVVQRERLRLLAVEGLQKLVNAHLQKGDHWAALQAVTRLVGIEPLLEHAHRIRMLLLARTGQRPQALQQYEAAVDVFEKELGIPVSSETTELYERIMRLALPPPCHLPARRRHFIGRTAELETLQQALRDRQRRLVTLLGTGGIGKTRLTEEVARRIHHETPGHFLDGIYFVELSGISGESGAGEALATHIAQTLSLPLSGNAPSSQQVQNALAGREILLILDNFEQLVEHAAGSIADLLQAAPHLTLLVTSRERLNLYEETILTLHGLPAPLEDGHAEQITEAVQLFLHNVQQADLQFDASSRALTTMGAICRQLEGVPLGIELAAGWVRHHAVDEIARRLEQSAAFLATNFRNVPERHRSLRSVFLHSWDLLTEKLRPILVRLSVFPGQFNVAAAHAIAGAEERDLHALLDKSLLQKVGDNDYAIHPLLREFAAEQLDAATQRETHSHHSDYFAAFIADRSRTDRRAVYMQDFSALINVYDDLLQAWAWAVEQLLNNNEQAWQWVNGMRRPLLRLHFQRQWLHAARILFGDAREKVEAHAWHQEGAEARQRLFHAQLTVAEGNFARILGDLDASLGPIERVVPILHDASDVDTLFDAYNALAGGSMQHQYFEQLPELLEKMEEIAVETQRPIFFGVLYTLHSYYKDYMGQTADALTMAQEALAAFRSIEDSHYEAIVLDGIARRLFTLNRPDEAADALRQAYVHAEANDQTLTKAYIQKGLAHYYRLQDELAEAQAALDESRQLFIAVNDQRNLVEIDLSEALIAHGRQQWSKMARHVRAGMTRAHRLQMSFQLMEGAAYLPILKAQQGLAAEAAALAHFVLVQAAQQTPGAGELQQQMAREALAMVEDELSADNMQEAEQRGASLTLDEVVEGLAHFRIKT